MTTFATRMTSPAIQRRLRICWYREEDEEVLPPELLLPLLVSMLELTLLELLSSLSLMLLLFRCCSIELDSKRSEDEDDVFPFTAGGGLSGIEEETIFEESTSDPSCSCC